jgi:small subunit ribosomal protein S16
MLACLLFAHHLPTLTNYMVTIRLSRTGKRKQPYYRIVVQDSQKDPWSPAIEVIGNLDPRKERKDTMVNKERAEYWLKNGAQPSATVKNLFIELGLMKGKKVNKITITAKRAKAIEAEKAKA